MRSRRTSSGSADISSAWHMGLGWGLDLMKATFWTHALPPHAHDYYMIEVIELPGSDASPARRNVP